MSSNPSPAKSNAKDSVVVSCPSPDGFNTRASRLASTLGRYVNRARGYVMSERQAQRFEDFYRDGWDADPFHQPYNHRRSCWRIKPESPKETTPC